MLLDRQALHARRLKIAHPMSGAPLEFIAELPEDLQRVLAELRSYRPVPDSATRHKRGKR